MDDYLALTGNPLDDETIIGLATLTEKQASNPLWYEIRSKRLTASLFGDALQVIIGYQSMTTSIKKWQPDRSLNTIPSIKYGKENEIRALQSYARLTGRPIALTDI